MGDTCRAMFGNDPLMLAYHDHEWCRPRRDDRYQFEMLCLEGASTGLSWATVMRKREGYRRAFHGFDIDACAAMADAELDALLEAPGIVRNRAKVFGVRRNARAVQAIQAEFGSFDAYLWGFAGGKVVDGHWAAPGDIPTRSEMSAAMAKDMKRRGMAFVGPVITYSFMQAVGIVNDHLRDCGCREP